MARVPIGAVRGVQGAGCRERDAIAFSQPPPTINAHEIRIAAHVRVAAQAVVAMQLLVLLAPGFDRSSGPSSCLPVRAQLGGVLHLLSLPLLISVVVCHRAVCLHVALFVRDHIVADEAHVRRHAGQVAAVEDLGIDELGTILNEQIVEGAG